jgi:DNA-binding transcriptional MerR regulator
MALHPKRPEPRTKRAPSARITIEQLAQQTGLTVRHLRELQRRGALEPPELEGRKGFYNARHVARVALVRRLQERGYSLSAIADLLRRWQEGAGIGAVLGLEDVIMSAPSGADRELTESELRSFFPELKENPALLEQAIAVGLLQRREGLLVASNGELLMLGRAFIRAGMSPAGTLAEFGRVREDCIRIAARLRENFMRDVFAPLQRAGMPATRLAELSAAVSTVRPAAARAVFLLMEQALYGGANPPSLNAKAPLEKSATKRAKPAPKKKTARKA